MMSCESMQVTLGITYYLRISAPLRSEDDLACRLAIQQRKISHTFEIISKANMHLRGIPENEIYPRRIPDLSLISRL
jgi:hypothetical protein